MKPNVEEVLEMTKAECLRHMEAESHECRMAWFYTHCGEIEMAGHMGHITIERVNELDREWRSHKPVKPTEQQKAKAVTQKGTRADHMASVARLAMQMIKMSRPDKDIDIAYSKEDAESIKSFTEWQRERNHIQTGDEYFYIWDVPTGELLYAVNVSADSILTAASELMHMISWKF